MNEFNRKIRSKINDFSDKRYLDGYIKNEFKIEDGYADIYLNIENKNELIDSWTIGDQIDLASNVYEYIEEKTAMLGNNIQIRLHITDCDLSLHEQGVIKHVLKEHFAIELYKIQRKYSECLKKIIALFLVGFLCLGIYIYTFFVHNTEIFLEIFSFVFSFALWEAISSIINDLPNLKYDREAITQNLLIDVVFDKKDN